MNIHSTRTFCAIFAALVALAAAQEKASILPHAIPGGNWCRVYLKSSPFPHTSRLNGHSYQDKVFTYVHNYSDSSAVVFIPDSFALRDGKVDMIVHFHGWGNEALNVLHTFNMPGQMLRARVGAILVFAQGPKNAQDSAAGKMGDDGGFVRFVNELLEVLYSDQHIESKKPGQIIITAHSGGYNPALLSLARGGLQQHVKEVYLFDAFYAKTELLIPWLLESKQNLLRSVYTPHLAEEHEAFRALLEEKNIAYSEDERQQAQVMLLKTNVGHNRVVDTNFEKWLGAGHLAPVQ